MPALLSSTTAKPGSPGAHDSSTTVIQAADELWLLTAALETIT